MDCAGGQVYMQLRQCFIADLYAAPYWKARRQSFRQRSQAAARLRAAKQQADAGGRSQDDAAVTEAKLALQQAECAVEVAANGPGSVHDALQVRLSRSLSLSLSISVCLSLSLSL
eukprot:COSAG03_NODE_11117_length_610_cov_2.041096_1_plen_114_part_10